MTQTAKNRGGVLRKTATDLKFDPEQLSISQAAKLNQVSRQAIYIAIKLQKLKATKDNDARWTIHIDDLEDYISHKYCRSRSHIEGELIFDNTKGFYSINQVAKMLDVPVQKIYYATRVGQLKGSRKGAAWVIHMDDVKEYLQNHFNKAPKKGKQAS
ncbi:MAG: helix-turn-helix domain-containing protein [Chlamydiia bacterium]|nr:helix-turn-helix domain-containing protein [Chlamydiia bacterium]